MSQQYSSDFLRTCRRSAGLTQTEVTRLMGYARERAEYDEKMATRTAKEKASGKKLRGKQPVAPEAGPTDKDQINLTDEESRIMPVSGGSFEQAYNAQAGVDAATMLVVAIGVTQATNDKQQVIPML